MKRILLKTVKTTENCIREIKLFLGNKLNDLSNYIKVVLQFLIFFVTLSL